MCLKVEKTYKKDIIFMRIMVYMFIFSALGTIIATLSGGILSKFVTSKRKELFNVLQNFSVGGIIALTFTEILLEGIEHFQSGTYDEFLGILYSLLIVCGTGFLFFVIHEGLHKLTHHHDHDHNDDEECLDHAHSNEIFSEKSLLLSSFVFLIAIFVHNIPEGLSLGINFLDLDNAIPLKGIIMSVILFLHNLLIGFTMSNSFLKSGKTFKFSLSMTTLSAIPAYVLAICGFFISTISLNEIFLGIIYSISTGSLLYVLFIELLPQIFKEYKSKYSFLYLLLGFLVCGLLISIHIH